MEVVVGGLVQNSKKKKKKTKNQNKTQLSSTRAETDMKGTRERNQRSFVISERGGFSNEFKCI